MKMNKIGIIATITIIAALLVSTITFAEELTITTTNDKGQMMNIEPINTEVNNNITVQTQEKIITTETNERPIRKETRTKTISNNEHASVEVTMSHTKEMTIKTNNKTNNNSLIEKKEERIREQIEKKIAKEKEKQNKTKKYTSDMKQIMRGEFKVGNGAKVVVSTATNNEVMIQGANSKAKVKVTLVNDGEKLRVKLSNGEAAEVNVMPDKATEEVTKKLKIKNCSENCSIELTEVKVGDQTRAAYKVEGEKKGKFLGLFKINIKIEADVDATNGEVIAVKKPWWSFLASEE